VFPHFCGSHCLCGPESYPERKERMEFLSTGSVMLTREGAGAGSGSGDATGLHGHAWLVGSACAYLSGEIATIYNDVQAQAQSRLVTFRTLEAKSGRTSLLDVMSVLDPLPMQLVGEFGNGMFSHFDPVPVQVFSPPAVLRAHASGPVGQAAIEVLCRRPLTWSSSVAVAAWWASKTSADSTFADEDIRQALSSNTVICSSIPCLFWQGILFEIFGCRGLEGFLHRPATRALPDDLRRYCASAGWIEWSCQTTGAAALGTDASGQSVPSRGTKGVSPVRPTIQKRRSPARVHPAFKCLGCQKLVVQHSKALKHAARCRGGSAIIKVEMRPGRHQLTVNEMQRGGQHSARNRAIDV